MDDFVPYQEASELKALGFDEECFGYYVTVEVRNPFLITTKISDTQGGYFTFAPTFSQAFRWFREKYGLKSWIQEHTTDTFIYEIRPHKLTDYKEGEVYVYEVYEEAELALIDKLIEILKNK